MEDPLARLRARLTQLGHYIHYKEKQWLKSSMKLLHAGYFGTLFMEGHSYYAMVGGCLFVYCFLDLFIHFDEG